MQPRLGLLKAPAAFQVEFVPRFISELKLFDLRHSLYTLRLFRGWVFLLPTLPLFANTTYVFVCLVNLVYGRSNLHVSRRRFTMHWPSPVTSDVGHLTLRRLMSNCEERGRSRNSMLVPNLLPKAVPHGSRLLPGLIVRTCGRLVAGAPALLCAQKETRPSGPALRERGHHPGDPRAVAPLPQRARLLALRLGPSASLLPEPVHSGPVQPQGTSPGARVARCATSLCRGPLRAFSHLPGLGHHPHPGHGPSQSVSQGALCLPSHLWAQRVEDRVGLRVQGGAGGGPRGRGKRLLPGPGLLRRETHRGRPRSRRPLRRIPGRQGFHGHRVGAALAGGLWGARRSDPEEGLSAGLVERGSQMSRRQAADHRGGDLPAQGLLRPGAPPGEDVGWAAGSPGRQGRGLHLWTADQRLSRPTAATFGGPARLAHCTSVVLELR